jgi:D-sedoheptulose 7-phosphate isomerase
LKDLISRNLADAALALDVFRSQADNIDRIASAASLMASSISNGGKIISCGNGGSMCDAMHFAEELSGRFREDRSSLPAMSISDPSHLSCVGNDYGFEFVFSRFIEAFGKPGDVLLAISTSGNSANVLRAAETARNQGVKVVGLTGKDGGKLGPLCDIEIRAPHAPFADRAQEIHIKIIHSLIHVIELQLK